VSPALKILKYDWSGKDVPVEKEYVGFCKKDYVDYVKKDCDIW